MENPPPKKEPPTKEVINLINASEQCKESNASCDNFLHNLEQFISENDIYNPKNAKNYIDFASSEITTKDGTKSGLATLIGLNNEDEEKYFFALDDTMTALQTTEEGKIFLKENKKQILTEVLTSLDNFDLASKEEKKKTKYWVHHIIGIENKIFADEFLQERPNIRKDMPHFVLSTEIKQFEMGKDSLPTEVLESKEKFAELVKLVKDTPAQLDFVMGAAISNPQRMQDLSELANTDEKIKKSFNALRGNLHLVTGSKAVLSYIDAGVLGLSLDSPDFIKTFNKDTHKLVDSIDQSIAHKVAIATLQKEGETTTGLSYFAKQALANDNAHYALTAILKSHYYSNYLGKNRYENALRKLSSLRSNEQSALDDLIKASDGSQESLQKIEQFLDLGLTTSYLLNDPDSGLELLNKIKGNASLLTKVVNNNFSKNNADVLANIYQSNEADETIKEAIASMTQKVKNIFDADLDYHSFRNKLRKSNKTKEDLLAIMSAFELQTKKTSKEIASIIKAVASHTEDIGEEILDSINKYLTLTEDGKKDESSFAAKLIKREALSLISRHYPKENVVIAFNKIIDAISNKYAKDELKKSFVLENLLKLQNDINADYSLPKEEKRDLLAKNNEMILKVYNLAGASPNLSSPENLWVAVNNVSKEERIKFEDETIEISKKGIYSEREKSLDNLYAKRTAKAFASSWLKEDDIYKKIAIKDHTVSFIKRQKNIHAAYDRYGLRKYPFEISARGKERLRAFFEEIFKVIVNNKEVINEAEVNNFTDLLAQIKDGLDNDAYEMYINSALKETSKNLGLVGANLAFSLREDYVSYFHELPTLIKSHIKKFEKEYIANKILAAQNSADGYERPVIRYSQYKKSGNVFALLINADINLLSYHNDGKDFTRFMDKSILQKILSSDSLLNKIHLKVDRNIIFRIIKDAFTLWIAKTEGYNSILEGWPKYYEMRNYYLENIKELVFAHLNTCETKDGTELTTEDEFNTLWQQMLSKL